MSPVLVATIGGLVAAVGWGSGNYLVSKLGKKSSPITINNALNFYGMLVVIPVLLLSNLKMPSTSQLLIMAAAEIFINVAYLLFIKAMSSGTLGIVVPISSTYPIFVLLLTVAIIGTAFTGLQILAMLGIVLGAVVLAYEKNHKGIPLRVLHKETALALSAAMIFGVGFFILNYVVDDLPWQVVMGSMYVFGTLFGLLLVIGVNRGRSWGVIKASLKGRTTMAAGFLLITGGLGFYVGADRVGSVVIPSVLSSIEPLVTSFWGAVIDKEKIGILKRIGAVIIVAGIILLNL